MGVLGLSPFLQKYCPQVIKVLPDRLKTLSGKTIAIDGTLITQRLHFAAVPSPNRHVLGWYRLLRELREADVNAICVFDGQNRGVAKQQENERRRRVRKLEVARGAMEIERLRRLRYLITLLNQYKALPAPRNDRTTRVLRNIIQKARYIVPKSSDSDISQRAHESISLVVDESSKAKREVLHTLQEAQTPPTASAIVSESLPASEKLEKPLVLSATQEELQRELESSTPARDIPNQVDKGPQKISNLSLTSTDKILHRLPDAKVFKVKDESFYQEDTPEKTISLATQNRPDQIAIEDPSQAAVVKEVNPPVVSSTKDILKSDGCLVSSVSQLSSEQIDHLENAFFTELEDFFDVPKNSYIDVLGKVNASQPYATQVPVGMHFDVEHTKESTIDNVAKLETEQDTIIDELSSLFQSYNESMSILLLNPVVEPPVTETSEELEMQVVQEQYAMSKYQIQLAIDEGNLWASLADPSSNKDFDEERTLELETLAQRSEALKKSYERRNNLPTQQTYDESKLIIQAMGVPCLESDVPYEAEGLAASLVHRGLADYVASEDTDVLIYEAPLLRNLANRQGPLTLYPAAEIREELQLTRQSYVDFALLLGTDFSQRIKNIGPQRAIKLIRCHGRIEDVLIKEPKITPRIPPKAYLEQVQLARLVFETLPPVPEPDAVKQGDMDEAQVIALLDKFGVYRSAMAEWDYSTALEGNYYNDNPAMV